MNKLDKYLSGDDLSEKDLERLSEKLINAKRDRDKKREWMVKLSDQHNVERIPANKSKKWLYLLAVAATLSLLLSVYLLLPSINHSGHMKLVDHHIGELSIMSDQSNLRKSLEKVEALRQAANIAYIQKKYAKSIKLWQQLIATGSSKASDQFYLGLCYLQKEPAEAAPCIEALLKARVSKGYEAEIAWVLSLAYLKEGKTDLAQEELKQVLELGQFKVEEAKVLLKSLAKEK